MSRLDRHLSLSFRVQVDQLRRDGIVSLVRKQPYGANHGLVNPYGQEDLSISLTVRTVSLQVTK